MDKKTWIFIAIALAGVFFLGEGMTGFVVSQTCCFPPNCPGEELCTTGSTQPLNMILPEIFGLVLIANAIFLVNRHKK